MDDALINKIISLSQASPLLKFDWFERGRMPIGCLEGLALYWAQLYSRYKAGNDKYVAEIGKADTGDRSRDVLAYYAPEFADNGMGNSVSGLKPLRHAVMLSFALWMEESTGKFCCGRDPSAENVSADTAEAGGPQTSWNAHVGSHLMVQLFSDWVDKPSALVTYFHRGVACSATDLENYGSGTGRMFQEMSKAKPEFAEEFALIGMRNIRQHWGTIDRKTVKIVPGCNDFLQQISDLVDAELVV